MSWIAGLEEERRALEQMIAERSNDSSPSVQLSVQSLRRRLAQVIERLADSERPRIKIDLTGPGISDHEIKLDALGPFLDELQETVSSIGQALRGSATAYSSIPMEIREETALSLVATAPGSVILLVPQLRNWYERPVIATLEVTISYSLTTGVTRTKYLLVGLSDAPASRTDD